MSECTIRQGDCLAVLRTMGEVALSLGRRAVLIELNPEYCELARRRTDVTPLFSQPLMVAAPRAENLEMDLTR